MRTIRQKDITDLRNSEGGEEWSPTGEDIERNFRVRWTEEHTLVWGAHQLEQWTRRLAIERGEDAPDPDAVLATVRNALEHLNEANFDRGEASPGP